LRKSKKIKHTQSPIWQFETSHDTEAIKCIHFHYLEIQWQIHVNQQHGESGKHRFEGFVVGIGGDGRVNLMTEGDKVSME